jgi:DNA-binding CsgD family transcriptional regulator
MKRPHHIESQYKQNLIARAGELHVQGQTLRQISLLLGVTPSTAHSYVQMALLNQKYPAGRKVPEAN